MIEFKNAVLGRHGHTLLSQRMTVPIAQCADWFAALAEAGFDPSESTLWLAEGLMMYLPAEIQHAVLGQIDAGSAPGSRCYIDFVTTSFSAAGAKDTADPYLFLNIDWDALPLAEDGSDHRARAQLTDFGWTVSTAAVADVATGSARLLDSHPYGDGSVVLMTAQKSK
ncbi:hypothetical protein AW168_33110 [Nocardia brasiliensis]|uniref:O-methyltransferase n=1 Tax=Nocardia brasiliensis (strain ATCC 700358 / HUJEG-1) TaxID=1133849 RepID=K0F1D3_NOCB7|nr:O-methyltransferase [Nocardia brasiliensis ATCC 700358]OCF86004.1 hypothetical protein AW168_33110 [Nocardia brasiliensis]